MPGTAIVRMAANAFDDHMLDRNGADHREMMRTHPKP